MKSKTTKVLHPISGRSMIGHVLDAVAALEPHRVVAVGGTQREQVGPHIQELLPEAVLAVQETQDGTGHAVRIAWEALDPADRTGTVLVAYGDTPLLEGESLRAFAEDHVAAGRGVSILSGVVVNPHGYGRVLRDSAGEVTGIVEQKDATAEQAAVSEINSGILAFDATFLDGALPRLTNDNANGEYYLTDTVQLAREDGLGVGAFMIDDVIQTEGVNDRAQLAILAREKNRRILTRWMKDGVTIIDPDTTWVDVDVRLERDVTILPGVQLLGATVVAEDAVVGPDCTLKDVEVGAGARVVRTHAELAVIGAGADVGPFSYLRPGTELGAGTQVGERADVGPRSYDRELSVGAYDAGPGTDLDVLERAVRSHHGVLRDHRGPQQLHAGKNRDVALKADIHVDPGGVRIDDRHAVLHPASQDAAVLLPRQDCELRAVVDPLGLDHVVDHEGADTQAVLAGELHCVGEVVLPVGVVVGQPRQGTVEEGGVESQDPAVDLRDGGLLRSGVLLLDDPRDLASRVPQHAAVPVRVHHHAREDAHAPSGGDVVLGKGAQALALEQRGVAVRHQDGAGARGWIERLPGDAYGVPGAVLGLLDHEHRPGQQSLDVRTDLLALSADDRDDPVRLERRHGVHHVPDHAATRDRVQNLHGLGLHPGATAGSEDDDGYCTAGDGLARGAHAPRVGVEPTSLVLIQRTRGTVRSGDWKRLSGAGVQRIRDRVGGSAVSGAPDRDRDVSDRWRSSPIRGRASSLSLRTGWGARGRRAGAERS